jgi:hypothetical protein
MLRVAGPQYLSEYLDNDPEILAAMESEGLASAPSSYIKQLGISLQGRSRPSNVSSTIRRSAES